VLLAAALALATQAPVFLCTQYLPGWALGLGLAALHGHYEHAPAVTDCRARWWNLLFLNDGLHAEHHARPGAHYTELPRHLCADARTSRWPPVLRWLEQLSPPALLDLLERAVLRSRWLQRRVLAVHRRALAAVLAPLPAPARVAIVGGGLFPRSAILLRELLPRAEITVLEANPGHVELARGLMPARIRIECAEFRPGQRLPADLLVLPLALRGCRAACVRAPGAPVVLLHDWLWRRRGEGRIVAWWLLKRLVLVRAGPAAARARATGLPAAATA
jgi:hypothetical protein